MTCHFQFNSLWGPENLTDRWESLPFICSVLGHLIQFISPHFDNEWDVDPLPHYVLYDVNDYESFLKEFFSPQNILTEKINGLTGEKATLVL